MSGADRIDGAPAPHRHTWPDITFSLDDGHPWMTMRCPCGAERRVRAYERYRDPDTDPVDDAGVAGRPGAADVEAADD